MRKKVFRVFLAIIEYGIVTGIGFLLYKWLRLYATELRGSQLYGGEVMMLGMPIYWAAIKTVIMDIRVTRKDK